MSFSEPSTFMKPLILIVTHFLFSILPIAGSSAESLEDRVSALEVRITELEMLLSKTNSNSMQQIDISKIQPGTYSLDTSQIGNISEAESGFMIYHTMTTVRSGEYAYSIQFGAGRKGLLTWQFYIDYDNDGISDIEMVEEYLDSLPLMGLISRSIDREASQNVYKLLIENIESASYTPPEQISENASAISQQIWQYVQDQSNSMAEWIKQRTTNVSPEQ